MKDHVKRFSMPAGALVAAPVGARFHPTLARGQRLDSHCLRAHCTIKRPRVRTDHLVRQTMLHRHDDFPPRRPDAGHQVRSDGRCLPYSNRPHYRTHYRIRSARNFSTCHCSLRATPHITKYRQAAACPRAAQQKRRRTEVSVPHSGSPGTVGRHNNTPNRVCIRMRVP
jgi:hypothetical protein